MAIITINTNRQSSGSYERLTGNKEMAALITAYHAASISTGTQVSQKLIKSYVGNLPIFYGKDVNSPSKTLKILKENPNGVIIFNGYFSNPKKQEIDVILYVEGVLYCYEIKDGDNLDTKKSKVEIDVIESAKEYFKVNFTSINLGIVCVNMVDDIHHIKDDRADSYVISGPDFCDKFSFNFNMFCELQINEQPYNQNIVLDAMQNILLKMRPDFCK